MTMLVPLYSYLLDETDRIQIWNRRRLSPRTANLRHRCRDTVPKATSSCHLWRTTNLPGILRRCSIAIQYIILKAVHIQGQGTCGKYDRDFQCVKRSTARYTYVHRIYRGMNGSRSHTPDPLSPETSGSPATVPQRQGGASPTMQQRIKAIGVPTPLAISSPIRRYIILVHYQKRKIKVYINLIYLEKHLSIVT